MARVFGSLGLSAALGWMYRLRYRIDAPAVRRQAIAEGGGGATTGRSTTPRSLRFWNAAGTLGAPLTQMLRLLLLLGVRRSELSGMRRAKELSTNGTVSVGPTSSPQQKINANTRRVVARAPARQILASVPVIEGPAGFMFSRDGKHEIGNWSDGQGPPQFRDGAAGVGEALGFSRRAPDLRHPASLISASAPT